MKAASKTLRFVASAALVLWSAAPAAAYDSSVDMGAFWQHNFVQPNVIRQAKFEEYHPMPNGFVMEHFTVGMETGTYELRLDGKNINQLDQEFRAEGGKPGSFMWNAEWNQTPHTLSYSARSLYRLNGSRLEIPTGVRGAGVVNAAYIANIGNALNSAPYVPLGIQQEEGKLGLNFRPGGDWVVNLSGDRTHRFGAKPMQACFGFNDNLQFAQPVDHLVHQFGAEVGLNKKNYQFNLNYEISAFHNNMPSLMFDNPQAVTSVNGTSSVGRMSLEPDNMANEISASFGVNLTPKTHFTAEGGLTVLQQNAPLDETTANTAAYTAAQIANGSNVRQYNTADRRIAIYTQNYLLSSRLSEGFRTSLGFRGIAEDNRSPVYTFPGYVHYDGKFTAGPVSTGQEGYTQNDIDWKADWDLTKAWGLAGGYTYETKKQPREIPQYYEQRFNLATTVRPSTHFFMNLSYLLGLRRMKAYDFTGAANPNGSATWAEQPGLVRFDVGDRNRNQGRLQLQYNNDGVTYGLSGRVMQDRYRPGRVPLDGAELAAMIKPTQYGLLKNDVEAAGFNFDQPVGKRWGINGYGELEYTSMLIQSNMSSYGTPVNQDYGSDWAEKYQAQTVVGGLAVDFKPTDPWKWTASYDFVSSIGHLNFLQQDPVNTGGNKLNGSTFDPLAALPAVYQFTQTYGLKSQYKIAKALTLNARYQFWKYNIQDWSSSSVPLLTPQGTGMYLGATRNNYYAHTIALGADYRF